MKAATLLPKLRHRADVRTLLFVALALVVLVGNWSGIYRNPASIFAAYPLTFICCIAAHNHMHLAVFRSRFWNSCYQIALTFAMGQPPTGIITAHNERHHNHLDSDLDFVRTSLVKSRWNVLNLLLFPFASIAAMYREKPNDLAIWRSKRPRLFRQAILERVFFYVFLLAFLIMDWRATLLFLVLPWLSAQIMLVGINLLQHQDCDSESEYDHSRNLTGKMINFFLLNNGFHTAHHLRPAMHWSRLPTFQKSEIAPYMKPSLNHRSFLGLILKRVRRSGK